MAAQLVIERAAWAQLHHQVRPAVSQHSSVVDVNDVRMPGKPPGRRHLTKEAPLVALGVQDSAVHLHGRLAANRHLPGLVDGSETARAKNPGDAMPRNVWCRDHSQAA